ncbi:NAD-dependent protein deacetylase [Nesterenkonia sp. AN1]|uniref:protein acetyllysine N-acetyltransferase n=1 Tax=Nesterenkonia aurantiaca TaxID=1436010 RepID=A0A4R7G6H3_9MICC|nr:MULTISPECIES: Sir2 family NAD-dependent protein deacetylase [Nesterenkonia]EXF23969.1 NAD-dependent protein deacetylase [Nesterenkonia sp. AN1]TDS86947.1 NAD-dependent SIR2 family protein deacetylase [Nesterenkonia aurantiaca]
MEESTPTAFTKPVENAHKAALRSIARVVKDTAEPQSEEIAREGIRRMLQSGDVLCVTGAGVSTDSGIPDYRGPQGSLHRHRPMTYQEFQHDAASRRRYWARGFVGWRQMHQAEPNHAHRLLADWQSEGLLSGLITQNVDGLHRAAGADPVIHLHGDMDSVICLRCDNREARSSLDTRLQEANPGYAEAAFAAAENVNPDGDVTLDQSWVERFHMVTCLVCGSEKLKPDVVYFGESVPAERKAAVEGLVAASSALLVVGSSMAVMSGFKIALTMHQSGRPIGVINGGPSRADTKADWRWRTRIAPALQTLDALLGEEAHQ